MKLTLLYFDDCPNWVDASSHLDTIAAEVPGAEIERRIVDTPELAEELGFRGSPTVLADGRDLFADGDAPVGLSCRIYQTPSGTAGSPTLDQLRAALGLIDED